MKKNICSEQRSVKSSHHNDVSQIMGWVGGKQIKYQSRIRKFPCNGTRRQRPTHCQYNAREGGLAYWKPKSPRFSWLVEASATPLQI